MKSEQKRTYIPIQGQFSMEAHVWNNGKWCHPVTGKPAPKEELSEDEINLTY